MTLLDTDHINVLTNPESRQRDDLSARLQAADNSPFATTAISVEEQVRGWLALINRTSDVVKQNWRRDFFDTTLRRFVFRGGTHSLLIFFSFFLAIPIAWCTFMGLIVRPRKKTLRIARCSRCWVTWLRKDLYEEEIPCKDYLDGRCSW